MASEAPVPLNDDSNEVTEKAVSRSLQRKNKPGNVPKKIHKAEREKLKRDSFNVLFLKLSHTLEPALQNNGKASTLSNASRLLRDLFAQVDCLKRENTALLSESDYVSTEKSELRDENSTLQGQIEELKSEIQARVLAKSVWELDNSRAHYSTASESNLHEDTLVVPVIDHASPPAPVLGPPLYVVPMHHHDLEAYRNSDTLDSVSKFPSSISRPQARYPSSSDCWPSQILDKQSETTQMVENRSSN